MSHNRGSKTRIRQDRDSEEADGSEGGGLPAALRVGKTWMIKGLRNVVLGKTNSLQCSYF